VDQGVAEGAGGPGIDFTDDYRGALHGLALHGHAEPQAAVARFIGRCDLDEGDIDMDGPGAEKPGDPGKTAGDEIHSSLLNRLSRHPAGKECLQTVLPGKSLIDGHGVAQADQLDHLQVLKIRLDRSHEMLD